MDYQVSKSEKKRRAKNIEKLAQELISLSPAEIRNKKTSLRELAAKGNT
jgi:ribosomal 50S subunit-associated protein YjgA (DUF615 family)